MLRQTHPISVLSVGNRHRVFGGFHFCICKQPCRTVFRVAVPSVDCFLERLRNHAHPRSGHAGRTSFGYFTEHILPANTVVTKHLRSHQREFHRHVCRRRQFISCGKHRRMFRQRRSLGARRYEIIRMHRRVSGNIRLFICITSRIYARNAFYRFARYFRKTFSTESNHQPTHGIRTVFGTGSRCVHGTCALDADRSAVFSPIQRQFIDVLGSVRQKRLQCAPFRRTAVCITENLRIFTAGFFEETALKISDFQNFPLLHCLHTGKNML